MQHFTLIIGLIAGLSCCVAPVQGQAWTAQHPANMPREQQNPRASGGMSMAADSSIAVMDSMVQMVKPVPKVAWQAADFAAAKAESAQTGKPILIKFTATWCGPCRLLEQQTFADSSVADFVNGHMVPLALDVDTDFDGIDLAREHRVRLLPTVLVMDAKGKVTKRYEGMFGPTAFLRQHRGY